MDKNSSNGAMRSRLIRLQSWLLPLIMMLLIVVTIGIHYETSDDAGFANILAGAYGPDRTHLVFLNVLIGYILQPFYQLNANYNWYVLLLLLLIYLSSVALCYMAEQILGFIWGSIIFFCGALLFCVDMLFKLQWTKVAGICVVAGLTWIAVNLGKGLRWTWPGIALALVGSLIRFDMFLCIGGLSAAMLLGRFSMLNKVGRYRALRTMALLFALVATTKVINELTYQLDPDWRAYQQYNNARSSLIDYKLATGTAQDLLVGKDLTQAEYDILQSWNFDDWKNFSTQRMAYLAAQIPNKPLHQAFYETLYKFPTLFYDNAHRYFLGFSMLSCLFLTHWNKRRVLCVTGTVALLWMECAYLVYCNRFLPRIEVPLLLAAGLFLHLCIGKDGYRLPPKSVHAVSASILLVFAVVVAWPGISFYYTHRADYSPTSEQITTFDMLSQDKEHLYLLSGQTSNNMGLLDVWHPKQENYFSNIFFCGSWMSFSPPYKYILASYGLSRPLVDAVDNDKVYLDANNVDIMVAYVEEQLGYPIHAIHTGPYDLAPWQLVSGE